MFYPRPFGQMKEIRSSGDLLLMSVFDIYQDAYCFPHLMNWNSLGSFENTSYRFWKEWKLYSF